jgi:hypothetical protein
VDNSTVEVLDNRLSWDPRLDQRGAKLIPYKPMTSNLWYKLIHAEWLDPSRDKPTIMVEVLDEQGKRIIGVPVRFTNGGEKVRFTEEKPNDRWATDHPMFNVGCAHSVEVAYKSDVVKCLGLGSIEDPDHAHHSGYYFVFQRTTQGVPSGPQPPITPAPTPPPAPPIDLNAVHEALESARQAIVRAQSLLT